MWVSQDQLSSAAVTTNPRSEWLRTVSVHLTPAHLGRAKCTPCDWPHSKTQAGVRREGNYALSLQAQRVYTGTLPLTGMGTSHPTLILRERESDVHEKP